MAASHLFTVSKHTLLFIRYTLFEHILNDTKKKLNIYQYWMKMFAIYVLSFKISMQRLQLSCFELCCFFSFYSHAHVMLLLILCWYCTIKFMYECCEIVPELYPCFSTRWTIPEATVNESCFFNEQCEAFNFQTECRDGRCICRFEMDPIVNKDGTIECKGKNNWLCISCSVLKCHNGHVLYIYMLCENWTRV